MRLLLHILIGKMTREIMLMIEPEFILDETQQIAVNRCVDMSSTNRIVPISGVAGTGKTTIIKFVYNTLSAAGYHVVLCAPTGKAAKRIYEATGIKAQTIHSLLEYPYPGERDAKTGKVLVPTDPKRGRKHTLDQKIIIADEYAMVGLELHSNLVAALPSGGRLLMFGDVNQLRPIEQHKLYRKESPFEQGIRRFNGIVLTTIHRHSEGSGIVKNGKLILCGRIPKREDDFTMIITKQPVKELSNYVMAAVEDGINFSAVGYQIISPTKKSWVGTYKINQVLQKIFCPTKRGDCKLKLARHDWEQKLPVSVGVGDKIIWTENRYDLRDVWECYSSDEHIADNFIEVPPNKKIMNGEIGVIKRIYDSGDIDIDVGDRVVSVPVSVTGENKYGVYQFDPRKAIELAYCITTHKSQGSEYDRIIYVLNSSTAFIQCRPNFYTAITRAKKHVTIITDQYSLTNAVFNTISRVERLRRNK